MNKDVVHHLFGMQLQEKIQIHILLERNTKSWQKEVGHCVDPVLKLKPHFLD